MINYSSRAFIFDMDGTLVDNMAFHTEAWQKMLEENGVEIDANEFLVRTAGKTNREILPGIFEGISDERIAELGKRKETLYRELFTAKRRPVDGVVEFLEESRELGIRMAVATAAPVGNMEFILDGLDLRRFFGAVVTAADIENGKPDPEIFLKSAERLDVEPGNCIVFEDAIGGFEAARRAGMTAIGITTVNSAETVLAQRGVVEAHADFARMRPEEIIERYVPFAAIANK